jgi:CubicO group peptidase (beta-lactamase class C family)
MGTQPHVRHVSASDKDVDLQAVEGAVARQAQRVTPGIHDMAAYRELQVADQSHREVLGPLRPGKGASGVVAYRGRTIASWGDVDEPEMCFSATKSVLSIVAGLAYDRGLIEDVHAPVHDAVDLPAFAAAANRAVTWQHLLQQTSGWDGEIWGKPAWVDAQSARDGGVTTPTEPGTTWAYNDVRVNLLALALTVLWRRPLADVVGTQLLDSVGASHTWSWHGYRNATVTVDGVELPVVSGGAHWGGGLWASAGDLARLGVLFLNRGRWGGKEVLSPGWVDASWQPCAVNPDYGYLWWLNDRCRVFPTAPASGRCARGNGGRHLLWVDPRRELVIASHWGEDVETLIRDISDAVTPG